MAEEDEGPTAPFWLVTYSDMVTLLLTFFVMIVAMSEIKKESLMEALSYFKGQTSVFENSKPIPIVPRKKEDDSAKERAKKVESLIAYVESEGLQDKVQLNFEEESIHIVITDSVMFNSGSSALLESAQRVLDLIASVTQDTTESMTVIGHTDNRPIRTSQFPSNWELSAGRAASVVRFLLSQENSLPPDRYQAIGKGEFDPVDTNETPEGRARNRRIELLINWKSWQNKEQSSKDRNILVP
jgi:chemotaxis protein MotB